MRYSFSLSLSLLLTKPGTFRTVGLIRPLVRWSLLLPPELEPWGADQEPAILAGKLAYRAPLGGVKTVGTRLRFALQRKRRPRRTDQTQSPRNTRSSTRLCGLSGFRVESVSACSI